MAKIAKPSSKTKGTNGQPIEQTTDNLDSEELVGLSFKVSPTFRREFRTYASEHDMSMRELLEKAFRKYVDI